MKRYFLPDNIDKWGMALVGVYERCGPADFEKYQYSVAAMLRRKADKELGEKLLEYVKDISEPKDVLLEVLISIMFNDFMNNNSRIRAVDALRVLVPKRMPNSRYTGEFIVRAMKDVINSLGASGIRGTVNKAMKSIRMDIQQNSLKNVLKQSISCSKL